jgi:uncharacterized protein with PIN domain
MAEAQPKRIKAKKRCCESSPRCKRCPVVLKRLTKAGAAERVGKRTYRLDSVGKKTLKAARRRG